MNVVLFGAPGAGKGTQSALLVENFDMRHISTGDLFRKHMKEETELGLKAKALIEAGNLVPDDITIGMVDDVMGNLNGQDFILDGFPRTVPQAEALDKLLEAKSLKLDKVISFAVPGADLLERLTGRRVCSGCGAVYHVEAKPPKEDGVCDLCGNDVNQRKDDSADAVSKRLEVYEDQTKPVMEFYQNTGRLVEVEGRGAANDVFERIQKHLKN